MSDIRGDPFEAYIRQVEPSRKELGYAWYTAIGLQAVDALKPSDYLKQTAQDNIEGKITLSEANELIESYYRESAQQDENRTKEADQVSVRIAALLSEKAFSFSVMQYLGFTHMTTMKNTVFRRDEIWFAAENADHASEIYSLYAIRNEENLHVNNTAAYDKQYLEGRYGADSYLRNMLSGGDWE